MGGWLGRVTALRCTQVTIEDLGTPDKIIRGFAPELFGRPVDEEEVLETSVTKKGALTYYEWYVKPFRLVSATAYGNRMFILTGVCRARALAVAPSN